MFDACVFQPVVQDALVRSALRPAPVPQTSCVTDSLELVCVRVERTVEKVETSNFKFSCFFL